MSTELRRLEREYQQLDIDIAVMENAGTCDQQALAAKKRQKQQLLEQLRRLRNAARDEAETVNLDDQ